MNPEIQRTSVNFYKRQLILLNNVAQITGIGHSAEVLRQMIDFCSVPENLNRIFPLVSGQIAR